MIANFQTHSVAKRYASDCIRVGCNHVSISPYRNGFRVIAMRRSPSVITFRSWEWCW